MPALAADMPPSNAVAIVEFVQTIGANVALYKDASADASNAFSSDSKIIAALNYSMIPRVRAGIFGPYMWPRFGTIYNATKIKYDIYLGSGWGGTYPSEVGWIKQNLSMIETVENANECDNWPPNYKGLTGYAACIAQQVQFYNDMQGNGVNVISTSLGNPNNGVNMGNMSSSADFAVAHTYPTEGQQTGNYLPDWLAKSAIWTPDRFNTQTEYGYSTPPSSVGVNYDAQAKLILNGLFDAYKKGVSRTYIFDLFDEHDNSSVRDDCFGIFKFDGTPKPAATAIHNMLNWLGTIGADALQYTGKGTTSLNYRVSNVTYGSNMLLQRDDGNFVLVIWAEPAIANNQTDLNAPTQNATVTLDNSVNATIYDPLTDQTSTASGKSFNVAVSDHPVFIQLGGAVPANNNPVYAAPITPINATPVSTAPTTVTRGTPATNNSVATNNHGHSKPNHDQENDNDADDNNSKPRGQANNQITPRSNPRMNRTQTPSPGQVPMVITETGYPTDTNAPSGVSQEAQAVLEMNTLLDAKKVGAESVYLYELIDESSNPGNTNSEMHYGLFNADGTPKPVATTIHNVTSFLADPNTDFTPGSLNYSISGMPSTGKSLLMQKSSGAYDIALWNDAQLDSKASQVSVPNSNVTVDLGSKFATATVFDPITGEKLTFSNVSQVNTKLSANPIIVEVGGGTGEGGTPAIRASAFTDGIGVNTHMTYGNTPYNDAGNVISYLNYLGVNSVRDGPNWSDSQYAALAKAGVKLNIVTNDPLTVGRIASFERQYPGAIAAVEGANEVNNWPVTFNGQTGEPAAAAMQTSLYQAVRSNSALNGVPVVDYTGGATNGQNAAGKANIVNIHPYAQDGQQTASYIDQTLQWQYHNTTPWTEITNPAAQ